MAEASGEAGRDSDSAHSTRIGRSSFPLCLRERGPADPRETRRVDGLELGLQSGAAIVLDSLLMTGSIPRTPLASTSTPPAILRMLLRTQGRPCRALLSGPGAAKPSFARLPGSQPRRGSHSLRERLSSASFAVPRHTYSDFVQEWLSAWNYRTGEPIYRHSAGAASRTGQDIPAFDELLPRNAHPPATVLVALPFGWISDYRTAHRVWNLLTLPLLLRSIVLVMRESEDPVAMVVGLHDALPWCVPCSVVLSRSPGATELRCSLFLLVAAWSADRRRLAGRRRHSRRGSDGRQGCSRAASGRLSRDSRWRAAVTTIVAALVINGAALMVFGPRASADYVAEVLPGLSIYRGAWLNMR